MLGASVDNGGAAVQSTCGTATRQQWQLRDAGEGYVNLVARHSGKCIDVLNRALTLAYALYKLKTQYTAAQYNYAVSRAWIYCIWYLDGGGQWIESNIPGAKIYETSARATPPRSRP